MDEPSEKKPETLPYASPAPPSYRGLKYWVSKFISRLSKPMPLGMAYLIMFGLSILATILVVIFMAIVELFR